MTAVANIAAGGRITAAAVAGVAPNAVLKQADQSVTNSTTLVNDTELVVPVVAGAQYFFVCYLDWEGAAGTGDIRWKWALPTGATLRYALPTGNINSLVNLTEQGSTTVSAEGSGAGVLLGVLMAGTLFNPSNNGSLQLTWAQNTANAGVPTIVHAQSALLLWETI